MQIVIINGSPRSNGATGKLLAAIKERLTVIDDTLKIYYFNLGEIKPRYCDGCLSCYRTGFCYIKTDNIEEISKIMEQSDGIIFGSPTYGSNASGHFKTFIDRAHLLVEQLLHNKPCMIVATYENAMGNSVLSILKNVVLVSGGYVTGALKVKVNHNNTPLNDITLGKINSLSNKFFQHIQVKHKKPLFAKVYNSIAFHFVLKPHAFKNSKKYMGVINHWINNGLISNKKMSI